MFVKNPHQLAIYFNVLNASSVSIIIVLRLLLFLVGRFVIFAKRKSTIASYVENLARQTLKFGSVVQKTALNIFT
jgi:hypothetical protein